MERDNIREQADQQPVSVLVYSDDQNIRAQVRRSLGKRPSRRLGEFDYTEVATEPALIRLVDRTRFDVLILDGEAVPAGGMGVCRQLKSEVFECPPVVVLIGRPQDAWLATWSQADGVSTHPIDPFALVAVVEQVLGKATESAAV